MKYIDLALCKHPDSDGLYLFQAPAWSGLVTGDNVIVETSRGEQPAVVQNVCIIEPNKDAYNCLVMATHATLPLKRVLSKVIHVELNYTEETANVGTTESV